MSVDAFELLALTMRYIFAGLMVLIVLRAARGALVDSRRAARLRRLSPMTGISGELVVLDPLPKLPRGRRFPVIREGMIGSSRRADVRIRERSVRRRHLLFQLTEAGLHIRTHAGTRLRDALGEPARELMLLDGDSFFVGGVHLMLVLSVPDLPRKPMRTNYGERMESDPEELFDFDDWEAARAKCDPISPIFRAEADPFDEPRVRRERDPFDETRVRRERDPFDETRVRRERDPISPIFGVEEDPFDEPRIRSDRDAWAKPRREKKRAFLSEDDLFDTDDKF